MAIVAITLPARELTVDMTNLNAHVQTRPKFIVNKDVIMDIQTSVTLRMVTKNVRT